MSYVYMSKNKFVVEGLAEDWGTRFDGSARPREFWEPISWHESESEAVETAKLIKSKWLQVRVRRVDDRTENTQAHQPY